MPRQNEPTTKFKVDISELKANIQEANRQIKLVNSEFKAATSGMDNWGKSADGIGAKLKQLHSVLDAEKTKLDSLKQQYQLIVQEQGAGSKAAQELATKINYQEATVSKTEKSIRDYNEKLKQVEKESKAAETASGKLTSSIDKQQKELDDLKNKYKDVIIEKGKDSDEAKALAAEINRLSGELRDNKNELKGAADAADELDQSLESVEPEKAAGGFTVLKGALAVLVADGIRAVISSLKDMVTESINVGKEFDSSMSEVQAISGATGKELDTLRETAKEYGATTVFSASESAQALKYMALAGWDVEKSVSGLGGVLDLAAASGMDLAAASDMVTDYLSAFGMEANQSAYFADMLAYAQSNSNTTAEALGEAYKNTAAVMNAAGQDVETVTSLLAMMANQGLKGSEAGTALTAMMRDLTAKMKDGAIWINDNAIAVMDSNGNYRDMTDILKDVDKATQGMGDAEKAAALSTVFTSDSIKGLNLIMNAGVGEAEKFEEALRSSDGTAKKMADTMNDNLGGDMKALSSQLEGVQISLYEKFEPALRKGVDILGELLSAVDFVVQHSKEFVAGLNAMAAAVLAYVTYTTALKVMTQGWKALTIVTKAQTIAQAALNAAMSLNPIGLVIAAIAALVVAFITLWNKSEEFRNFWIGLWDGLKSTVSSVVDSIVGFFTETLPGAFDSYISLATEIWGKIGEIFKNGWDAIVAFFTESIPNFIKSVINWFNELPGKIYDILVDALVQVVIWGLQLHEFATTKIPEFVNTIISFIKQLPGKIWNWLVQAAQKVLEWGVNIVTTGKQKATEFLTTIISFIQQLPGKMWDWFSQAIQKTVQWGIDTVNTGKQKASEFITAVIDFVKTLPGKVWEWFSETIKKAIEFGVNLAKKGKQAGEDLVKDLIDAVTSLPTELYNIGVNALNAFWDGLKSVGKNIKDWADDFFGGILEKAEEALNADKKSKKKKSGGSGGPNFSSGGNGPATGPGMGLSLVEPMSISAEEDTNNKIGVSRTRTALTSMVRTISNSVAQKTSEAKEKLKGTIRSMDGSRQADNKANKSERPTTTTVNNFTQNNYSPKPLSRLEIYRQTKNLVSLRG